jgi:hypothetical protein
MRSASRSKALLRQAMKNVDFGRLSQEHRLFSKMTGVLWVLCRQSRLLCHRVEKNRRTNYNGWILNISQLFRGRICGKIDVQVRFWRWRVVKSVMNRALDWIMFEWRHRFLPWRILRKLRTHSQHFRHFSRSRIFDNMMQKLKRCDFLKNCFMFSREYGYGSGPQKKSSRTLHEGSLWIIVRQSLGCACCSVCWCRLPMNICCFH